MVEYDSTLAEDSLFFTDYFIRSYCSVCTTNTVDLVLLAVLFVVSGVRLFPEKKLCTYIYFGVALLMLGILAVGFML